MVNAIRWIGLVVGLAVLIGCILIASGEFDLFSIDSPSDGATVETATITVSGTALAADFAVIESVTVNGVLASGTSPWSAMISLQPGSNTITAVATDNTNSTATETITVYYDEPTPPPTDGGRSAPAPTPSPTPTPTVTPTGSISITTVPPGAEVCLDGSRTCTTPCSFDRVSAGSYNLSIVKEGYINFTKAISLGPGETEDYDIELEPLTGCINVSSIPPGASVSIDGDPRGETPLLICDVDVGSHSIKLTKSCYRDITEPVFVSVNETIDVPRNLTGYGSLEISSDPPGARIYLGGEYKGETPKRLNEVAEGSHSVKLNKSGYDDETKSITIHICNITYDVVPLKGYGSLAISSNPTGAKVYLDSVYQGKTPLIIKRVPEGPHTIESKKFLYADATRITNVLAGETIEISESLSFPSGVPPFVLYFMAMSGWIVALFAIYDRITGKKSSNR